MNITNQPAAPTPNQTPNHAPTMDITREQLATICGIITAARHAQHAIANTLLEYPTEHPTGYWHTRAALEAAYLELKTALGSEPEGAQHQTNTPQPRR